MQKTQECVQDVWLAGINPDLSAYIIPQMVLESEIPVIKHRAEVHIFAKTKTA